MIILKLANNLFFLIRRENLNLLFLFWSKLHPWVLKDLVRC